MNKSQGVSKFRAGPTAVWDAIGFQLGPEACDLSALTLLLILNEEHPSLDARFTLDFGLNE